MNALRVHRQIAGRSDRCPRHPLPLVRIEDAPQLLYNRFGAVIGMVYVMLPYMVLSIFAVMSEINPNYQRAARSLGAGPFRAFLHVYLPQSYAGVTGGVLLVFIYFIPINALD